MTLTRRTLLVAAIAHLAVQVALTRAHHFFASEDDGYRLYQAYLLCSGQADPIGRFWLPAPMAMTCPALAAGASPIVAGLVVSMLSLVVLAWALAAFTRRLVDGADGAAGADAAGAAFVLVLASPMAATLSHSALAELPAAAACALAALGLFVRVRGGSRAALVGGTVALLVATWTRYECWPLAALYPVVAFVARRGGEGGGDARRVRTIDAAIAALAGAGPVAWMALQAWRYGDPLTFVHATAEITAQGGHAGVLAVLAHRLVPLVLAPALLGALVAAWWSARGTRIDGARAAVVFLMWMATGVLLPALAGAEHPVFPERLSFALEVGLVPLAAVTWAAFLRLSTRPAPLARRVVALAAIGLALLPLVAATTIPTRYLDRDSVAVGLGLRAGRLAPAASGRLLVERPEERPPLGWASLAAAWAEWPRLVFATPTAGQWELVEPTDVRRARTKVADDAALAVWLAAHEVTAAWCVSPTCVKTLRLAWPGARVRAFGRGRWIDR